MALGLCVLFHNFYQKLFTLHWFAHVFEPCSSSLSLGFNLHHGNKPCGIDFSFLIMVVVESLEGPCSFIMLVAIFFCLNDIFLYRLELIMLPSVAWA